MSKFFDAEDARKLAKDNSFGSGVDIIDFVKYVESEIKKAAEKGDFNITLYRIDDLDFPRDKRYGPIWSLHSYMHKLDSEYPANLIRYLCAHGYHAEWRESLEHLHAFFDEDAMDCEVRYEKELYLFVAWSWWS
jgi:hypothetical protein